MSSKYIRVSVLTLAFMIVLSGCTMLNPPEIVEQQCGNVLGAGGCVVTVENPSNDAVEVTVTVKAIAPSGDVAAKNSETVVIEPKSRKEVPVEVSNIGGDISHYEASLD